MNWFSRESRAQRKVERVIRRYADSRTEESLPTVAIREQKLVGFGRARIFREGVVNRPCWNYSSSVSFQGKRLIVETTLTLPEPVKQQIRQIWPSSVIRDVQVPPTSPTPRPTFPEAA